MELLRNLRDELSMSVILISHDLGLVSEFADRAMVMYAGQPVETGPIDKIFDDPLHPYTEGLLSAIPDLDDDLDRLPTIPGSIPEAVASPAWMPLRPALHLRTGKLRQTPTHNEPDGWAGQPLSAAAAHRGVCPMSDVMTANRRSFLAEDGKETIVRTDDLVRDFDLGHRPEGGRLVLRAVDKVSLTIRRGETLGLVGESGSGKSTIGRMLVGLLNYTSGNIELFGQKIEPRPAGS